MHNYCDCRNSSGELILAKVSLGKGKMQITEVDSEGVCIHCGYYAKYGNIITHTEVDIPDQSFWIKDDKIDQRKRDIALPDDDYMMSKHFKSNNPVNKRRNCEKRKGIS